MTRRASFACTSDAMHCACFRSHALPNAASCQGEEEVILTPSSFYHYGRRFTIYPPFVLRLGDPKSSPVDSCDAQRYFKQQAEIEIEGDDINLVYCATLACSGIADSLR